MISLCSNHLSNSIWCPDSSPSLILSSYFYLSYHQIGNGKFSLKLQCPLIPASLSNFLRGTDALLAPHFFRVNMILSESSNEVWLPITDGSSNFDLQVRCPDVMQLISNCLPIQEFSRNEVSDHPPVILPLDKDRKNDSDNNIALRHPTFPALTSEPSHEDQTALSTAIVPFPIPQTSSDDHPNSSCPHADTLSHPNTENASVTKIQIRQQLKRRIGPAPSLMRRRKLSTRLVTSSTLLPSTLPPSHKIGHRHPSVLSFLRPTYRKSVVSLGQDLICLIGEFPFAPLTVIINSSVLICPNFSISHHANHQYDDIY